MLSEDIPGAQVAVKAPLRTHILLVVDETLLRSALAAELGGAGYDVTLAREAQGALGVVSSGVEIDAAVICVGDTTGDDMLCLPAILAEHRPRLPLVVLRGRGAGEIKLAGRQLAVPMPLGVGELLFFVRSLLAGAAPPN